MVAPTEVEVPVWARLCLGHAVVQRCADDAGADVLHVKGPATDPRLRMEGRTSSDVDVLVRPAHVEQLMAVLEHLDFEVRTHFETGSIFRHASNLHHAYWGWVDVHRAFPGIGIDDADSFEQLWVRRDTRVIAGHQVAVPDVVDQALLVVLHGARDTVRGRDDVEHVRGAVDEREWAQLTSRAGELDALVALAAATGELNRYRDRREHDLWQVMSQGGTRWQEWRARVRAADSLRGRVRIVGESLRTNPDHLRMRLGHVPTAGERARAALHRPAVVLHEVARSIARRRGGSGR